MGFRQFFKRAVKPLVVTGIAGTLAVSLVATTPSNAQAFLLAPALPAVFGATSMILPELVPVAAIMGPVGWGLLGVTALAVGAAATQDYWLPYVTGAFGQGDPSSPAGEFSGSGGSSTFPTASPSPTPTTTTSAPPTTSTDYGVEKGLTITEVTESGGFVTVKWNMVDKNMSAGFNLIIQVIGSCKRISDGKVYYSLKTVTQLQNDRDMARSATWGFTPCPSSGWQLQGYMAGGGTPRAVGESFLPNITSPETQAVFFSGNSATDNVMGTHGPENVMSYGTFAPGKVDPKTEKTKYVTTVECVKNDGQLVSISAESLGNAGGLTVPSCAAAGLGHGTGKVTVDGFLDGSTTPKRLLDTPAPAPAPDKPLCDFRKPGTPCKLAVKLDTKDCVMGLWECEHWAENSKNPDQAPRYSCQYGPYSVPLSTCNPLERAYEPNGAPTTDANTDGNPDTRSDTGPDGKTDPGTTPGTGTVPGIVPGAGAAAPPEGSTQVQKECFPTGWSMLNPVEWVMKPVGCALDAAFRPKKDLQSRLSGMQGQFSNKVPLSWFGFGVEGASGGGCPTDWAVTFDDHRYSLICGTEADNIIRGFRPVLGGMLITAMLWPFVRSLFYAAIPVFKVTPS